MKAVSHLPVCKVCDQRKEVMKSGLWQIKNTQGQEIARNVSKSTETVLNVDLCSHVQRTITRHTAQILNEV